MPVGPIIFVIAVIVILLLGLLLAFVLSKSKKKRPEQPVKGEIHMFCPRCGKRLDGAGAFCVDCGASLGGMPGAGAAASPAASLKAKKAVHKRQNLLLAAGVGFSVLVLIIGIVLAAVVIKKSSQDDSSYDGSQQSENYGTGGSYDGSYGSGSSGTAGGSTFDISAQQGGHMEMCAVCHGTGVCTLCDGSGKVWGWKQKVTCTSCHGSCSCVYCSGSGYVYVPY